MRGEDPSKMAATPRTEPGTAAFSSINRPIHLARRDAFFERAVELLSRPVDALSAVQRQRLIGSEVQALEAARRHAFFASDPTDSSSCDQDFLRFLDLKIQTIRSAGAMVDHQLVLEEEEGFLCNFLQVDPREFQLPAMHFKRRSEDIIHGLWHLLRLAQSPFVTLRRETRDALQAEEQERYDRAYGMARSEAQERFAAVFPT